jgi:Pyridine nucleotide-disulphide oxidoreductase
MRKERSHAWGQELAARRGARRSTRPGTALAAKAGTTLGFKGAIAVDTAMRTNLPDVFAAGDCVVTHHRLLGQTYLPLGTTAHKQGRVAGENALGGKRRFAGSGCRHPHDDPPWLLAISSGSRMAGDDQLSIAHFR